MSLRHGVALVGHADGAQPARGRILERVTDDAVHAFPGVDLFLDGDLVLGASLETAADAGIDAFGVLTEHDEADVGRPAALQRAESLVEQRHRPIVHVQVERDPHAEQDVASVTVVGDAWIADGAEEDGIEVPGQLRVAIGGKGDSGGQKVIGAVRQRLDLDLPTEGISHRAQDLDDFGGDVATDAVAGNERDSHGVQIEGCLAHHPLSDISCQLSVISCQLSVVSCRLSVSAANPRPEH